MPDPTFLIALAGAALGAASLLLHVIAPRTKTLVDDQLRDDIDEVLAFVRGQPAMSKPPSSAGPAALALLLLAGAGGLSLTSCATARPAVSTGVVAALDCETAHLDAQALADALAFARAEVQHWIAGGTAPSADAIRADLAPIRSDLGRCAIAGALAALTSSAPPTTGPPAARVLAGPPGLRAAFEQARQQLGWGPVRLAGGDTL